MIKKAISKVKQENEKGARTAILEDLFYDFHTSRRQVYLMNLIRGIFFGVGSVIGGTLVVALAVWVLSFLVDIPGGIGDSIESFRDTVQKQ